MVDYASAIKRPFTDIKTWILGAVISIIPIVNFMAYGYGLSCAGTASRKDFALPGWEWGAMWVKGLLALVIGVVYALPALIVLLVTGGLAAFTGGTAQLGVGGIIALLLGIIAYYITPLALVNYQSTGEFAAAFAFGDIFRKAFTSVYLVAWLVALLWGLLLSIVAAVLSLIVSITIIGPFIVYALLTFTIIVTSFTIYGEAYAEIR